MAKIPGWAQKLPDWASFNPKDGYVEVDPDVVYPLWLKRLEKLSPQFKGMSTKPTQCALEAARFIFTRVLKKAMYDGGGDFLNLRILRNKKWALENYPPFAACSDCPQFERFPDCLGDCKDAKPIDTRPIKVELGLTGPLRPRLD